jgi:hypothetical protein
VVEFPLLSPSGIQKLGACSWKDAHAGHRSQIPGVPILQPCRYRHGTTRAWPPRRLSHRQGARRPVTPAGPIPKALRPIFRDRNDFDPGYSLGAETGAALDDSAALILLASPHAARSKYVNGEVRLFKSRHPDRPVIPLIIDGTPGDAENEYFRRPCASR